jgi:hypothetical protein
MPRLGLFLLTLASAVAPSVVVAAAPASAPSSVAELRTEAVPLAAQPQLAVDGATLSRLLATRGLPSPWPTAASQPHGRISVAFGPDGRVAVAYLSGRDPVARVAQFENGIWTTTTVDSRGLFFWLPSVAFAPDGSVAVAYVETGRGELRLARGGRGTWQVHPLEQAEVSGCNPSLRFEADGTAAILFDDLADCAAKCARFDDQTWQVVAVDGNAPPARHALASNSSR